MLLWVFLYLWNQQAWYLTEATEAIASVAPGLCLGALSKVPNRNVQIPHRGALCQGKIALPLRIRNIRPESRYTLDKQHVKVVAQCRDKVTWKEKIFLQKQNLCQQLVNVHNFGVSLVGEITRRTNTDQYTLIVFGYWHHKFFHRRTFTPVITNNRLLFCADGEPGVELVIVHNVFLIKEKNQIPNFSGPPSPSFEVL